MNPTLITYLKESVFPLLRKNKLLAFHLATLITSWILVNQYKDQVLSIYTHHIYEHIMLWGMPVLLLSITYFLSLYIKYRPKYKRFLNVYWDKDNDIRCPSCKRLLAPSFFGKTVEKEKDKSVFQCHFCDRKTILKNYEGQPISIKEAIELRNNLTN